MNVLLDTCVWGGVRRDVERAGHDVVWSGDWPEDPGDEEILLRAHSEARVLVTLDKDFGELAVLHRKPHHGIVRLVDIPARSQAGVCLHVLRLYGEELQRGAIATVEQDRIRIRPPDP